MMKQVADYSYSFFRIPLQNGFGLISEVTFIWLVLIHMFYYAYIYWKFSQ